MIKHKYMKSFSNILNFLFSNILFNFIFNFYSKGNQYYTNPNLLNEKI